MPIIKFKFCPAAFLFWSLKNKCEKSIRACGSLSPSVLNGQQFLPANLRELTGNKTNKSKIISENSR